MCSITLCMSLNSPSLPHLEVCKIEAEGESGLVQGGEGAAIFMQEEEGRKK